MVFEYNIKTVFSQTMTTKELNVFGLEGWELVLILPDNRHIPAANHYHFKRQIHGVTND